VVVIGRVIYHDSTTLPISPIRPTLCFLSSSNPPTTLLVDDSSQPLLTISSLNLALGFISTFNSPTDLNFPPRKSFSSTTNRTPQTAGIYSTFSTHAHQHCSRNAHLPLHVFRAAPYPSSYDHSTAPCYPHLSTLFFALFPIPRPTSPASHQSRSTLALSVLLLLSSPLSPIGVPFICFCSWCLFLRSTPAPFPASLLSLCIPTSQRLSTAHIPLLTLLYRCHRLLYLLPALRMRIFHSTHYYIIGR
jgi:hypothetical protein